MSFPPSRQRFARAAAAGLTALAGAKPALAISLPPSTGGDGPALAQAAARTRFNFARDHVLGTSFDLAVDAVRPADAARVEQAVLAEITRLSAILSTYDPDSEISRVAAGAPVGSPSYSPPTPRGPPAPTARLTSAWRRSPASGARPLRPAGHPRPTRSAPRSTRPARSTWTPLARAISLTAP